MRSLVWKWMLSYLLIGILIIASLTAATSWLIQQKAYERSWKQLADAGQDIQLLFDQVQEGRLKPAAFRERLQQLEKHGSLQISIQGKRYNFSKAGIQEVGTRPDVREWVRTVMEGGTIQEKKVYARQQGTTMLIRGFPLQSGGEVAASCFVYRPVKEAVRYVGPLQRALWLVSVVFAIPVSLVLWLVSRAFTRPVLELSRVARSYAEGRFETRAQYGGRDELADLAGAIHGMADKLGRVEAGRRRFIGDLAHELRTPLTTVRAALQGMDDGIMSEEEKSEFTRLALSETRRLQQLIDDLTELTEFEEHVVRYRMTAFDLGELLQQCVLQLTPAAEEAGMTLSWQGWTVRENSPPIRFRGDQQRIRQVVLNLIGNAIRHNDAGTAISVSGFQDGSQIGFDVRDDGRGIPEEMLPRIWDRFMKADGSRSGSSGSGLGLTISRYITEAHGGTIQAVSSEGNGTRFEVVFPSAADDTSMT
ncbi:ATP-binding protein [Paenibacillus humicus]|uniref:sensor histidine kinase n=1 Tax=Paenibacillus humicus TaxID=412861 RepID=UPI003F187070